MLPSYTHSTHGIVRPIKKQRTEKMATPIFIPINSKFSPFSTDEHLQPSDNKSCAGRTHASKDKRPRIRHISTNGRTKILPLPSPQTSSSGDDNQDHPTHPRRPSKTPSTTSASSASDPTTICIRQPPATLARTESLAIENEVLTIRHLSKLTITRSPSSASSSTPTTLFPVPSILRILRSGSTGRLTTAVLKRPSGIPLSHVRWPASDPRSSIVASTIQAAQLAISVSQPPDTSSTSLFGPVASVASGIGLPTWPSAFGAMFNALLLDAEDSWLNLPYAAIRAAIAGSCCHEQEKDPSSNIGLIIEGFGMGSRVLVDERTGEVTGFLGFRDAFWGDPEAIDETTRKPVYRMYQAVKVLVVESIRPSKEQRSGDVFVEARAKIAEALAEIRLRASEDRES